MKRVKKIVILCMLIVLMIGAGTPLLAQIGGNAAPLQYSVHTYSIVMANTSYTPSWGLYPAGTTQLQIESGTVTALVNGTHYTMIPVIPSIVGGRSYFKIQFSTTSPTASGDYVIGYKETTDGSNLCITAVVLSIHVWDPFDVDMSLNDSAADEADCPDGSDQLKLPGDRVFQTTVPYLVTVTYPSSTEGGYASSPSLPWSFNFEIGVDGEGAGANATISSITATAAGGFVQQDWTPLPGTSVFLNSCSVTPSSVTPVLFTIVYNDVLGVEQDIYFKITDIRGPYGEQDIDVIKGSPGNSTANTVYAMPDVGDILVWN